VVFHEITPHAIKAAFGQPHAFDLQMVEAQVSRRILDRLVGYFLSPLLWKKLVRGLSAGRVQSVALRLVVEREREIQKFIPREYWEIEARLEKAAGCRLQARGSFLAKLEKVDDKKAEIGNRQEAEGLITDIKKQAFKVLAIKKSEKKRYPQAPFITSTLQQEAFNKLRFNATKTMIVAQQLYEGINIGKDSPTGLITYMRTDSPRVAPEAIKALRSLISRRFGKKYLPAQANIYQGRKLAQQAHEAIRPTLISRSPESLKGSLSPEQYKLYALIYARFLASQMTPARYLLTSVDIGAGRYLFTASGTALLFDGFTVIYNSEEDNQKTALPPLKQDEVLALVNLVPSQHFTKPPARFSDSSLVKALEEASIGRPSTYAPIIQTLILRDYLRRLKGYFHPTELGFKVCQLLVEYFPKIMDVKFTALMEEELDEIEEGALSKERVLQDFYPAFKQSLDFAQEHIKKEVITTDEVCEQCGRPLVLKWGRKGRFLSCSGFPECRYSKSITSGVKCPQAGCSGELLERRSRRGFFYGCSNFPKCRFTCRSLPEDSQKPKVATDN
jgi:DNA topoisomerase-1